MKKFDKSFCELQTHLDSKRTPDFNQILKILRREKPDRNTLFEFFLNDDLYMLLSGYKSLPADPIERTNMLISAYANAGYDYVTVQGSDFEYPKEQEGKKTLSINDSLGICDWESFEKFNWPDPSSYDYSRLDICAKNLPDGMKFIVWGSGGVLENVILLTGYENLCYMMADDPELVSAVFEKVGSAFVKYYEICAQYDSVGALISNDDWGFNTQTMLSIPDMRKYVFPWHKKIVEVIHKNNKPAILHSCGRLNDVIDDIAKDIGFDAKHSYEDNILPVEQAYEKWSDKLAILGGIDMDFVCRAAPEEIYNRACAMLEKSSAKGGYALGSGNSIPDYVPVDNYLAMISAAVFNQ